MLHAWALNFLRLLQHNGLLKAALENIFLVGTIILA
jgi:hypothetical protein